jgi:hypothetical protein
MTSNGVDSSDASVVLEFWWFGYGDAFWRQECRHIIFRRGNRNGWTATSKAVRVSNVHRGIFRLVFACNFNADLCSKKDHGCAESGYAAAHCCKFWLPVQFSPVICTNQLRHHD